MAKLDNKTMDSLKADLRAGLGVCAVARKYGISHGHVSNVKKGLYRQRDHFKFGEPTPELDPTLS